MIFVSFMMCITQYNAECCNVPFVSRGPISQLKNNQLSHVKDACIVSYKKINKMKCDSKQSLLNTRSIEHIRIIIC